MEAPQNFTVPDSLALSDSGFLFLASTGETFTLNGIGKEVFIRLKEGDSLSGIREKMLAEYDADATTIERDIEDFLAQLKHFRLVVAR